jgi:hypothetical protein
MIIWDGVIKKYMMSEDAILLRNKLADASKNYSWKDVLEFISEDNNLSNVSRPEGNSLYAPLHQAAFGGAPVAVAERLIAMGAWRTLQNARGERPLDVAIRRGHQHLFEILTPIQKHYVPTGVLLKIQQYFHDEIRRRIDRMKLENNLRLPELEPLLELDDPHMWFPVPGMYGGFSYRINVAGVEAKLISESWCRVVGGSGQRHMVTSAGSELVEEGFV